MAAPDVRVLVGQRGGELVVVELRERRRSTANTSRTLPRSPSRNAVAMISGGRGCTGVSGGSAGSTSVATTSWFPAIELVNASAAARAVTAASSAVSALPMMRRMPVPDSVEVSTSPGSGRPSTRQNSA